MVKKHNNSPKFTGYDASYSHVLKFIFYLPFNQPTDHFAENWAKYILKFCMGKTKMSEHMSQNSGDKEYNSLNTRVQAATLPLQACVRNSGPRPERIVTVLHFGADLFINLQTPKLRIMPPLGIHLSQSQNALFSDIKRI